MLGSIVEEEGLLLRGSDTMKNRKGLIVFYLGVLGLYGLYMLTRC